MPSPTSPHAVQLQIQIYLRASDWKTYITPRNAHCKGLWEMQFLLLPGRTEHTLSPLAHTMGHLGILDTTNINLKVTFYHPL